jgi:sortase A
MSASSHSRLSNFFFIFGSLFLFLGLILAAKIYVPLLFQEIRYDLTQSLPVTTTAVSESPKEVAPPDPNFSIWIPKISALAPVVPDVDPYDSKIYQQRLTKGVAHAKGSAYPGTSGSTFLFAHSAGNPLEASQFNAVFYLLSKLQPGDEIFLWYFGAKYSYRVTEKRLVSPSAVDYLSGSDSSSLILMTCWPPGTTLKRYLVFAESQTLP